MKSKQNYGISSVIEDFTEGLQISREHQEQMLSKTLIHTALFLIVLKSLLRLLLNGLNWIIKIIKKLLIK